MLLSFTVKCDYPQCGNKITIYKGDCLTDKFWATNKELHLCSKHRYLTWYELSKMLKLNIEEKDNFKEKVDNVLSCNWRVQKW